MNNQKFSFENNIVELNNIINKLKLEMYDKDNTFVEKTKKYEKELKTCKNEIIVLKNQEEIKRE